MAKLRLIPHKTYKEIYRRIPIACVDTVVSYRGQFVLGKRVERPCRGQWWVAGGRVFKHELLAEAASRTLREEFHIKAAPDRLKFLTIGETTFRDSSHGGSKHTINLVFSLKLSRRPKLRIYRRHHSEARWFSEYEADWHPYLRMILEAAGFRQRK
ncbi:MAG: NUDIX domain-containing protein [Elusimicrobia bacterium]|nr:NUDIX domain-containing protein [Elusimicrobiota bacterium]